MLWQVILHNLSCHNDVPQIDILLRNNPSSALYPWCKTCSQVPRMQHKIISARDLWRSRVNTLLLISIFTYIRIIWYAFCHHSESYQQETSHKSCNYVLSPHMAELFNFMLFLWSEEKEWFLWFISRCAGTNEYMQIYRIIHCKKWPLFIFILSIYKTIIQLLYLWHEMVLVDM